MKIIAILLLHLIVVIFGLSGYLRLSLKMRTGIAEPPELQLFLIFGIYGGLLLMTVHSLTWQWSGMASLGLVVLLVAAPIIAIGITYSLRKLKHHSVYHYMLYFAGLLFIPILILAVISVAYFLTYLEEGRF